MAVTLDYLMVEDAPPASVITLNRPEQLNALSTGLMAELTSELERQAPRPEVRAIVLKGARRAFSAGPDLQEKDDRSLHREPDLFPARNTPLARIHTVPVALMPDPHRTATPGT